MREIEEQRIALECLRLADGHIELARKMLAFVVDDAAETKASSADCEVRVSLPSASHELPPVGT